MFAGARWDFATQARLLDVRADAGQPEVECDCFDDVRDEYGTQEDECNEFEKIIR